MATSNNNVNITINGKDNASTQIKKVTLNLRELGEKVQNIGMTMTGALTAPIVGFGVMAMKSGKDAADKLAALEQAYAEAENAYAQAVSGGSQQAIAQTSAALKEAQAAMDGMDKSTRQAANAYKEIQTAIQPVNDEFARMKAEVLAAVAPLVADVMPAVTSVVRGLANLAEAFGDMPKWARVAIVGFVGAIASIGPGLLIFGQVIKTIGTVQSVLAMLGAAAPAFAGGMGTITASIGALVATTGPVIALVGALVLLYNVVKKFGPGAMKTLMQIFAIADYKLTGNTSGLKAVQSGSLPGFANGGSFTVGGWGGKDSTLVQFKATPGEPVYVGASAQGGSGTLVINMPYSPTISTASAAEVEHVFRPMIEGVFRKAYGRS